MGYSSLEKSLGDIDTVVHEAQEAFHVPGIAVGIVSNGEYFARGYGWRDREARLPVTAKTLFPIASCTKAFTALLIGQLVEEGVLAWDMPISYYLPEFHLLDGREVTVRDLLAHRTGIPRHDALWYFRNISSAEVLTSLAYLAPISEIGQKWLYNNLMYSILGILIERTTGETWENAIHARLFKPLEMTDSTTTLQPSDDEAMPYAEIEGTLQKIPFRSLHPVEPGGAINSNLSDMLKWLQLHLAQDRLLKKETFAEMHAIQIPFLKEEQLGLGLAFGGYGLGWFINSYKGHEVLSHTGHIDGFFSEMLVLPQDNIGIVLLTNSSSDGRYAIAAIRNYILDKLLAKDPTDWLSCTKKERAAHWKKLHVELSPFPLPTHWTSFLGTYEHPAYGQVTIDLKNDQLVAHYGNLTLPLIYRDKNSFQGVLCPFLPYGVLRLLNFTFISPNEVRISFEPATSPLPFKKIHVSSPLL